MTNFSENLKDLIMENCLNIRELGERLDLNISTIYDWLSDESSPSLQSMLKLADLFSCRIDYVLGRSEQKSYLHKKSFSFSETLKAFINESTSINALCKKLQISRSGVYCWIKRVGEPSLENVIKLADYFKVSVDEMLGLE